MPKKKLRIPIPEKLSIICIGQANIFPLISPAITSVEANIYELGKKSVEGLLSLLSGENKSFKSILPVSLYTRETCSEIKPQ